jgi:proline dehydrogenase
VAVALPRTDLFRALKHCLVLRNKGIASTIGSWNRIKHSSEEVVEEYLTSLVAVQASGLDCYVSIKPLALAFRRELLMKLVTRARDLRIRLHFDSPSAELANITFSAIQDSLDKHAAIGCTLPGRWPRSLRDAEWAINRGLTVRVVKGQWADPDYPMEDARAGFMAVINRLAGRARQVGVATHDALLAKEAINRLRAADTPCELEYLADHPADHVLQMAESMGARVRGYVSYGDDDMVYGFTRPDHVPAAPGIESSRSTTLRGQVSRARSDRSRAGKSSTIQRLGRE